MERLSLGTGNHRGDVAGQPVGRHGHVDALGRPDGVGVGALVEGADGVGPHARGVDHDPGPDGELGGLVLGGWTHDGAVGCPVGAGGQADDRGVVGDDRSEFEGGGAGHGECRAGRRRPGRRSRGTLPPGDRC